jgi:WD40 repeat protein
MSRLMMQKPAKVPAQTLIGRWRGEIDDYVNALAWSSDGKLIAAASVSGTITIYDAQTGGVHKALPGHLMGTAQVAWQPKSHRLASIGQDGKAAVWDADTGEPLHVLPVGAAWGECLAWNRDGTLLATGAGKIVRLWDTHGEQLREFTDHPSTVTDLQWKPGIDHVAAGAYGGAVIWAGVGGDPIKRLSWQGSTLKLAWSPNARVLAAGQQDSSIIFWDTRKPDPSMMWGYPTKIRELAWDRTSRYLATGGGETVVIWDFSGAGPVGSKPLMLNGHQDLLASLAFQRNGDLLASGGGDGAVLLWLPGKYDTPLASFRGMGEVSHVVWSPDDKALAVGDAGGSVAVFDVK